MTQRERHASAGLSATAPAPHGPGGTTGHPAPPRPAHSAEASRPGASLWEDVFRSASPAQREELLSLAGRQGLLYAHQLPPPNSERTHAPAEDVRGLNLLSRLLQGQTGDLQPVRPRPVEVTDVSLDERQRDAVARAVESPDICLIQGLPGTGKSRVIAEIVTQAATRGDRVLLIAPGSAAIDRVLELVSGRESLCPIRCVGEGERAEGLSPAARAATFPERVRSLRAHALDQAVRVREQAEARCQRVHAEEALWPRLEEIAEQYVGLRAESEALRARREQVPADVAAEAERAAEPAGTSEAAGFTGSVARAAVAHREALARAQDACARADKERAERTHEVEQVSAEVEALRPLAEAKRGGRWWSPTWWSATLQGDVPGKLTEREARLGTARDALARLDAEAAAAARERATTEDAFAAEKRKLVEREAARRQAELDTQGADLQARLQAFAAEWGQQCAVLEHAPTRPEEISGEAVRAARARWESRRKEDEQHCGFACQWATYLEQSADSLAARLPGYANLVAATTTSLAKDEHFGDAAACGGAFDMLVLDEAERVADPDLLKLARRARRWVLVGEAAHVPGSANAGRPRGAHRAATPSAALSRTQAFQRLWHVLHGDPTWLPYAWEREGERLCCRLRQLTAEQRQGLESERVADCPDIELRILASPRVRPLLAEVVFPGTTSVAQAKEFIFRELQELPVIASEHAPRWVEEADRLFLCLSEVGSSEVEPVPLETGVRELVAAGADGPPYTCRLEFDRQAGWDRARAEQWVEGYLRLRDLGRTARLDVGYRMAPELCEVLSDVLFEGACRAPASTCTGVGVKAPAVEFVVVPGLGGQPEPVHAGGERRRREKSAVATRAEPRTQHAGLPPAGAGLEQDLSATGYSDRVPAELRARLPRKGLVNYPEAQAVVRRLEELAAAGEAVVAVIALYRAQAELIRLLVQESPALSSSGLRVEIDAPAAFRQREFPVVLVSLTRSHSRRAVAFGEEPPHLPLALTRACSRLVVFGDPGTLARRGQWEGVLDHLDETTAAREGQLIGGLVRYLQGAGRHGRAFRVSEGGGT